LLSLRFQDSTISLTHGTLVRVYNSDITVPYLTRNRR